jgi:histone-lysine N-methyltransferase SETD3
MQFTELLKTLLTISTVLAEVNMKVAKDKLEILKNWAVEHGSVLGNFEVKYLTPDNRFVVATEDIKKGDTIMNIPFKLMVSTDNSDVERLCHTFNLTGPECIPVFIANETKNKESFFHPFVDILPKDFDNFPYFYPQELKELIKGSLILDYINEWDEYFNAKYEKIQVKYNL